MQKESNQQKLSHGQFEAPRRRAPLAGRNTFSVRATTSTRQLSWSHFPISTGRQISPPPQEDETYNVNTVLHFASRMINRIDSVAQKQPPRRPRENHDIRNTIQAQRKHKKIEFDVRKWKSIKQPPRQVGPQASCMSGHQKKKKCHTAAMGALLFPHFFCCSSFASRLPMRMPSCQQNAKFAGIQNKGKHNFKTEVGRVQGRAPRGERGQKAYLPHQVGFEKSSRMGEQKN